MTTHWLRGPNAKGVCGASRTRVARDGQCVEVAHRFLAYVPIGQRCVDCAHEAFREVEAWWVAYQRSHPEEASKR